MVISKHLSPIANGRNRGGFVLAELVVAMTILALFVIPVSMSYFSEQKLCRAYYYKGVAMEIVDGEMEILKQGEWQRFQPGTHEYVAQADAAKNLPAGKFILTLDSHFVRLAWQPESKGKGGAVVRQARIQ
jgi:hypothetical protein